jgi:hypothetical protein
MVLLILCFLCLLCRGDKQLARQLSRRGQESAAAMRACHGRAADALLAQRNSAESLGAGRLDLHGLHIAEVGRSVGRARFR